MQGMKFLNRKVNSRYQPKKNLIKVFKTDPTHKPNTTPIIPEIVVFKLFRTCDLIPLSFCTFNFSSLYSWYIVYAKVDNKICLN